MFIGRAIRGLSHLREHPNDIVILPVVVVMVMVIALPLKVISILTMRRSGWMTRHSDTTGGEGQDNASLHHQGLLSPPEAGAGRRRKRSRRRLVPGGGQGVHCTFVRPEAAPVAVLPHDTTVPGASSSTNTP